MWKVDMKKFVIHYRPEYEPIAIEVIEGETSTEAMEKLPAILADKWGIELVAVPEIEIVDVRKY
jgi:hypothetical protein